MQGLADFLDSLLRGAMLVGFSLALGGVAWRLLILAGRPRVPDIAVRRGLVLVAIGATGLAAAQIVALTLKASVLSGFLGRDALGDFATTAHFIAGATRAGLALGLAGWALWFGQTASRVGGSVVPVVLALSIAVSGAWLTHAAGRLEQRASLMTLTVAHQVGAAVWVGGLFQLGALWRLARRHPEVDALWPALVARFSRLALASVLALVLAAVPLGFVYVGSAQGLIGTGFGSLVVIKVMLLGAALFLAAFNLAAARAPGRAGGSALRARLPYLVEAETLFAVMILFTAASLSMQPPAADLTAERATWSEVVEVFRPKWPELRTPSVGTMRADRAERERTPDAYRWSNFSHNVAGIILLGMSGLALVGLVAGRGWGQFWPLGFVLLAAFIGLRAAANEGTWPFGTTSLAELGAEGIQHRIAGLLVLSLGLLEWRARAGRQSRGALSWLFPVLAAVGGILLLTHSHTAFQLKAGFLVQVTHATMGALAAVVAAGRWLELRLAPPAARVAGGAAALAMLIIALVLVFYREANVVIPSG